MEPMSSKYLLIKAMAMGVDEVVLLNNNIFIGSDNVATSGYGMYHQGKNLPAQQHLSEIQRVCHAGQR